MCVYVGGDGVSWRDKMGLHCLLKRTGSIFRAWIKHKQHRGEGQNLTRSVMPQSITSAHSGNTHVRKKKIDLNT